MWNLRLLVLSLNFPKLTKARNLFFFTLLLDKSISYDTLWSVMYALSLDESTFKLISDHSKKLVALSASLDAWKKSGYAEIFRVVNSETMSTLNRFWVYYSWDINTTSAIADAYTTSIKKIYKEHYSPGTLSGTTTEIHFKAAQRFWEKGTVNPITAPRPYCNVLFLYCDAMKCHFPIHHETSPLAGFNYTTSLSNLIRNSLFFQEKNGSQLDMAIQAARMEFESWCANFRELASKKFTTSPSRRVLRIRFFIGDAVAFCKVLNERRLNKDPRETYTRPGGSQALSLDSRDYSSKNGDVAPTMFDVIETSHLIDRIGLLNILPHVIRVMKPASGVLYTSTRSEINPFMANLMMSLTCSGPLSLIFTYLGVVPTAYVTGHSLQTTQPYHPRAAALPHTHRIVWRSPMYGDTQVNASRVKPICDDQGFALSLYWLSNFMLSHLYTQHRKEIATINHGYYTPKSTATLLEYLRDRVTTADWNKSIDMLLEFQQEYRSGQNLGLHTMFDELLQINLSFPLFKTAPSQTPRSHRIPGNPVVTHCAIVITVPRSRLRPIFAKFMSHGRHIPASFQIYWQGSGSAKPAIFLSVQSVFGTLTTSADRSKGTIEKDEDGWGGNSDLHVCAHIPLALLAAEDAVDCKYGVRFTPGKDIEAVFKPLLGHDLSIFKATIPEMDSLRVFKHLPGLQPPSGIAPTAVSDNPVAYSDNTFKVSFPRIDIATDSFTTKVTISGDAIAALQNKATVELSQTSPCTLTVKFAKFEKQCSFPFPVDYRTSKIRVSRGQGWIEVITTFLDASNRGYFRSNPFPVTRDQDSEFYSFLPHINFRRLPQLDLSRNMTPPAPDHLMSMFGPQEKIDGGFMAKIKFMIHTLLFPLVPSNSGRVVRLTPRHDDDMPILVFMKGLHLDYNSESVVGEAYVLPITPANKSAQSSLSVSHMNAEKDAMKWWRSALPAMVEQCRDWQHSAGCEYRAEGIPRNGFVPICSCGEQPLGSDFAAFVPGWKSFPKVTKIAISPLFPVSFLETVTHKPVPATRVDPSSVPTSQVESMQLDGISGCKMCDEKIAKKCGKCMRVAYCSRECQVKDWKEHKKVCVAKTG
jgi:hypothetical protein